MIRANFLIGRYHVLDILTANFNEFYLNIKVQNKVNIKIIINVSFLQIQESDGESLK
jgi:hypothetical protein